ncbi:Bug family tripartite tricarboxylate transporter substrate binding protein [Noviherbaspirillum malthae]|uniref:Bug family tripartite tricarboxylate transporter substrate binding protein n=1 Tax=Noviherbaspirillum malthae TaxID=1260987 RepID=UPI0018903990|nr:tripartite tricarboxylate transporter substrate binding protein [Noviherbaspirillum malthae]
MKKVFHAAVAIFAGSVAFAANAKWPERAITIVCPFPAGNSSDVAARVYAEKLSVKLGQPVIVENRTGAAGIIGTSYAAKQPADGYTLLVGAAGPLNVSPWTHSKPLSYNSVKDFTTVGSIAWAPQVLIARKDLPVKDFKEFVAYGKQQAKPLQYGTSGVGTTVHLTISQILNQTGMKANHIPYRGGSQAITDLQGGHIDFMSDTVPVVQGLLKAGSVKALGVSTSERIAALPNVPTLKEQGITDLNVQGYITLVAPAKTPDAITNQITNAMEVISKDADVRKRLADLGLVPMDLPRAQLPKFIETQHDAWKKAVEVSGAAKSVD